MFDKKRRGLALGIVLLSLSALVACSDDGSKESGQSGGSLVVAYTDPVRTLDIMSVIDSNAFTILYGNVVETLTRVAYDGKKLTWEPSLAESWKQVEPTMWHFKLRDGVTFHNGDAFDATDAAFSINHRIRPEAEQSTDTSGLVRAKVIDEHTVAVETEFPIPYLPNQIYRIAMLPDGWGVDNPSDLTKTIVGTGPFKLSEYSPAGDRAVLTAWDKYWGDAPKLDEVELRSLPEAGARISALSAGEVDVALQLPSELIDRAPATLAADGITVDFVRLNTKSPALKDVSVRQAINHAIDIGVFVDNIRGGNARPANGQLIPPDSLGYLSEDLAYDFDPDKARTLLAAAGATNLSLTMWCQADYFGPAGIDSCSTVAQMLKNVGIQVKVETPDFDTFVGKGVFAPGEGIQPPDLIYTQATTDNLVPGPTLGEWFTCKTTRSTFCDPAVDAAIDEARTNPDLDAQVSQWEAIGRTLNEAAPAIWLTVPNNTVAIGKGVSGVVYPLVSDVYWAEWSVK